MQCTAFSRVLACLLALSIAPAAFSQPAPQGRGFQLSPELAGTFEGLALAVVPDGRFVAAWVTESRGGSFPVVFPVREAAAQVFDADGRPLSPRVAFAAEAEGTVALTALTLTGDDTFVVVWREGSAVFARRFGFHGRPHRDAFVPVPPEITSVFTVWPAACSDAEGRFVIAWRQGDEVWARRYDPLARPLGQPFRVAGGAASEVQVTMSPEGALTVAWQTHDRAFWGRFYASDGAALGEPVILHEPPEGSAGLGIARYVLAETDGDLLLAWRWVDSNLDEVALMVGELDDRGRPLGEPRQLPIASGVPASRLALGLDDRDDLLVLWPDASRPRSSGLFGRRFGWVEPGRVGLIAPRLAVSEAEGSVEIPVVRTEGSTGVLNPRIKTVGGSALPGADFVPIDGRIVFDDGDSRPRLVALELVDDAAAENVETLRLRLPGAVAGSGYGQVAEVVVEVRDDDAPPALRTAGPAVTIGDGPVRFIPSSGAVSDALLLPTGEWVVSANRDWNHFLVDRFSRDGVRVDRYEHRDDLIIYTPPTFSNPRLASDAPGNLTLTWSQNRYVGHGVSASSDWVHGWRVAAQAWWPEPFVYRSGSHYTSEHPSVVTAAPTADGRLAITDEVVSADTAQVSLLSFDERGGLLDTRWVTTVLGAGPRTALATLPEGPTFVVREVTFDGDGGGLLAVPVPFDGSIPIAATRVNAIADGEQGLADQVAPLHGRLLVVWRGIDAITGRQGVWGRWLGEDGTERSPDLALSTSTLGTVGRPSIAAVGDRLLLVWEHTPEGGGPSEVRAQLLDLGGAALGGELRIPSVTGAAQHLPVATGNLAGDAIVVWAEDDGPETATLHAQRLETLPGCPAVGLLDGRFELRAAWRSPHEPTRGCAQGRATGSPGVASFGFTGAAAQDVQVTLYDARRIDGHFWVLITNNSDFEHALTVIDHAGGRSKTYYNPAFQTGTRSDRQSFPG